MLTSTVINKFLLSHLFSFSQSHCTLFLPQFFFFFSKSDFLSLFLFTISSNTLSLSTFFAFGYLNLADDGSASFLISLFRCGDLVVVGLDLGLADMGISSFDVCLVVDGNFVVDLGA